MWALSAGRGGAWVQQRSTELQSDCCLPTCVLGAYASSLALPSAPFSRHFHTLTVCSLSVETVTSRSPE